MEVMRCLSERKHIEFSKNVDIKYLWVKRVPLKSKDRGWDVRVIVTLNEAALETSYRIKDLASSSYNYTSLSLLNSNSICPPNFGLNPNGCYQSYISNSFFPLFFWDVILKLLYNLEQSKILPYCVGY